MKNNFDVQKYIHGTEECFSNYESKSHVKELTITKSINCGSCGAGLNNVITNKCKCDYCGNTNLILDGGFTKIIEKTQTKIIKKEPTNSQPVKINNWIIILLSCVSVVLLFYFISRRRKVFI